jgi:hypothetical protein
VISSSISFDLILCFDMCLAACLQHRPLASMDIPWHSMTFHDPQVNVEGLRLLQSYSRGVCNCLWSSAATNLTSPGFWSMALVAVPVACWILSNFQICWLILSWFYLRFQHVSTFSTWYLFCLLHFLCDDRSWASRYLWPWNSMERISQSSSQLAMTGYPNKIKKH